MQSRLAFVNTLLVTFLIGCASQQSVRQSPAGSSTGYTAAFPSRDVSRQLSRIQQSVQRISSTAFYNTYYFNNRNVTLETLRKADNFGALSSRQSSIDQSKAGTAITIMKNKRHAILITTQHALAYPDTLIAYKKGSNIPRKTYIESIGIKQNQRNYIVTTSGLYDIDIIAEDVRQDMALIRLNVSDTYLEASPLNIRIGKARDLQLGSFLYILGYPLGSPMVTRGIVSAPDYNGGGSFLTDALFNHGISGGLIIATRNNFQSFEWVGMAVTASATDQQFLVPDPERKDEYESMQAYTDTAYISERRIINYGITDATPIEEIMQFLLRNEDRLNRYGFSVADLNQ